MFFLYLRNQVVIKGTAAYEGSHDVMGCFEISKHNITYAWELREPDSPYDLPCLV